MAVEVLAVVSRVLVGEWVVWRWFKVSGYGSVLWV